MEITQSLAAKAYTNNNGMAAPSLPTSTAEEGITQAVESFSDIITRSESMAKSAMIGDASPEALVMALASAETTVEAVVTVRDQVVDAYKEILRMSV